MDHGLSTPWRAFAQDARQGGGWGNFADTPITPNLLVIEAAMSIMVMVLLVIMVVLDRTAASPSVASSQSTGSASSV